jgi:hypothetical protein
MNFDFCVISKKPSCKTSLGRFSPMLSPRSFVVSDEIGHVQGGMAIDKVL